MQLLLELLGCAIWWYH